MIQPTVEIRSLRLSDADCTSGLGLLDEAECGRAERFCLPSDRDRFILGRALLRTMLGEALRCEPRSLRFSTTSTGKPSLSGAGDLAFNVSHSGDVVIVAVARARAVGIDVEQHRPDLDLDVFGPEVFTPSELACIAAAPDRTAAFTGQWVLKEAFLKGLGTGFSLDPRSVEIDRDEGRFRVQSLETGGPDFTRWNLRPIEVAQGYSAALAVLAFD